jgi:putative YphP/YqiW family bacilliredoxin
LPASRHSTIFFGTIVVVDDTRREMSYPSLLVAPMREELTRVGLQELATVEDVDAFMASSKEGTALIAVNSVCGCSAGSMRPAIARALQNPAVPDALATVFAGQDVAATERAREYLVGYRPSSPAVALFKDSEIVFMLERANIQGRHPRMIADDLIAAFDEHCTTPLRA